SSWQKHVCSDLPPYICRTAKCDLKLFPDPNAWMERELGHRVQWLCQFCAESSFKNMDTFKTHLWGHASDLTDYQLNYLSEAARHLVDSVSPSEFQFCD